MSEQPATASVMEQIVSLAKRRGFIYPASDIYGGIRGFWDYGPLGVLLKNNIRDHWWNWMVECPPVGPDGDIVDMVGLDSAIIQHPKTWEASGHVAGFNDLMTDCRECKERFRADHLFYVAYADEPIAPAVLDALKKQLALGKEFATSTPLYDIGGGAENVFNYPDWKEISSHLVAWGVAVAGSAAEAASSDWLPKKLRKRSPDSIPVLVVDLIEYQILVDASRANAVAMSKQGSAPQCPSCDKGPLTQPRAFNLMLDTYPGPVRSEANKTYLRPETAQGIFLNFKNIVDTSRVKVPFGVAQIGKSFRNEVTPRNFIFRSREFEQMEMEFFCPPDDALKWYEFWKAERMKWWLSLGVEPARLRFRDHDADELSHYSKATVDIEYKYPFTDPDYGELEGIAHRGDFDLTQHQKHSGQKLDYFDQELQLKLKEEGVAADEIKQRSRYLPNVIEPASGLTRAVLVLLCEAYTVDTNRPSGVYLKFKPKFAPIKLGIFPLVAKDGMPEKARALYMDLRSEFTCEFDVKQSIGKRYARMDEIGTPYCCTIDGDTMTSDVVTIRDRDTLAQEKVNIGRVKEYVLQRI